MASTRRFLVWSALALAPVAVSTPASAGFVSVPDAIHSIVVQVCTQATGCQEQVFPGVGTVDVGGIASGGVSTSPAGASGTASGGGDLSSSGEGTLVYFFEWVGPPGSAGSLPVDMDAILRTGATGNPGDPTVAATGEAYVEIANFNPGDQGQDISSLPSGSLPGNPVGGAGVSCIVDSNGLGSLGPVFCDNPDFVGTLHFDLTPNFVYEVDVFAGAGTGGGGSVGNQSALAFADPHIYLDPSFGDVAGYLLVLSDGIGNDLPGGGGPPSGAPEPGTMALVMLAIGLVAGTRGRAARLSQ